MREMGRVPKAREARRVARTCPVLIARALAFAQGLSTICPSLRRAIGARAVVRAARKVCRS